MKHILENNELKVEISELGATLVKFIDKKSNTDIVLGFDSDEDYLKNWGLACGASVGRNCNRIGGARFSINGNEYKLTPNDRGNNLHGGGQNGFAFKQFKLVSKSETELVLSYFSKDGEEGFPGNLDLTVTYSIDGNSLTWKYEGISDKDTILNMTNHSYFNLGDPDIMPEYLCIHTDKYAPTDDTSLTLKDVLSVKGTLYDFTSFTKLEDNIAKTEFGVDNNYVWETTDDKLMAELKNDKLHLKVYSDLPDMHLYTAYWFEAEKGKNGKPYDKYDGMALECQFYPNGINYDEFIKPVAKANEKVAHYIRYQIDNI